MNFKQAMDYMEEIKACGIVPGLTNIIELCKRLDNPQERLSFVHIAGSNGKGSVLSYVSTILKCAGYKVGRYISPVITDYCEKIQINGKQISQKNMADCITKVKDACDAMVSDGLSQPTPFEVETAAAFLYFADHKCDVVVLETGMGGREDATNLIQNTLVSVLTPISMDHMQFLGKTLKEIAGHKAGIIKPNCRVVSAMQEKEAMDVILAKAHACGISACDVTFVNEPTKVHYGLEKQKFSYTDATGKNYKDLEISLTGKHQIENAALAVEVIAALALCGYEVPQKALYKGLLETVWQGRFEVLSKRPYFVVDGAHNIDAAEKLASSIRFYFTNKRIIYIMGILKDKEYEKVIAATYSYADHIITVTPPENPRALPAINLAQAVSEYHPQVTVADSLEEAVEIAYLLAKKEDVIISFGSLSFLGRLKRILEKRSKR